MPKTYTVKDIANLLGFSTNTVYKYLEEGKIKAARLGTEGRFRIPESEYLRLAGQPEPSASSPIPSSPIPAAPVVASKILAYKQAQDLFDWFLGLCGIFLGLVFLFFPPEYKFPALSVHASYLRLFWVAFVLAGGWLFIADILIKKSKWQHFLSHFCLGVLFLLLGLVFLTTGASNQGALWFGVFGVFAIIEYFWTTDDWIKFNLLIYFILLGGGWLFVQNPFLNFLSSFPLTFLSVYFIGVSLIVLSSIAAYFKNRDWLIYWGVFFMAGFMLIAAMHINQYFWGGGVLAILISCFAIIFPYTKRMENIARYSRQQLASGLSWLTVIFFAGLVIVFSVQKTYQAFVFADIAKKSIAAAQVVDDFVFGSAQKIDTFSKQPDLVELVLNFSAIDPADQEENALDRKVKELYEFSDAFRRITIANEVGDVIAFFPLEAGKRRIDLNLAGRDYFAPVKENQAVTVSQLVQPKVAGLPYSIYIVAPLLNNQGNFVGVISGAIDFDQLSNRLSLLWPDDGDFAIANQQQSYIFHPDKTLIGQKVEKNISLIQAVEGKAGYRIGLGEVNRYRLQAYTPIADLNWGLVVNVDLLNTLRSANVITFGIFLATIFLGTWTMVLIITFKRKRV